MKITNNLLGKLSAIRHSHWMRPALMTLALLVAVLGGAGCEPHH